jgi:predicted ATPase/class 3 adenylate cyclase
MLCPRCQAATAEGARFCARCGTRLSAVPASSAAERRQLTVLFCDLVDSTALAVRLDPEDLRAVMRAYQEYVSATVTAFGGVVAQWLGDGVVVHFGWPQAHEHDADRAVRAGLALVGKIAGQAWPFDVALAIRVGIATGLVLVEAGDVTGETPNLAARLQTEAEPNTVLIAPATLSLVRGLFEYRDLGARPLKGFAEPVPLWQVVGESTAAGRFDALHGKRLGALYGRNEELSLLLGHWQEARTGAGRVVLLTGEPGIGKSRLTRALIESVAGEPHRRLRYFCSPHHSDSALHPVIVQIERAAGFERDDDAATRRAKFEAMMSYLATPADEAALLADLLSLEGADARWPRLDLAPAQRRQLTLDALVRGIEAQAERLPIVAVFEDVHWIDPTSLELLDRTIAALERLPVLLVVTARPGFEAPWAHRRHATEIVLNRLGRPAAAALVRQIGSELGGALGGEVVREILDQTDGVPLFIEELTRAVVEGGGEASPAMAIPTSLQASLMSRLDRLGPAKELAQLSAVIGRRFSWALLAAIADRSAAEVETGLGQLTASGLVFQEGSGPHRTYRFKHALVQSAAYESLLRSMRQQLHGRVAATLEAHFPATLPEQVAEHWAQADDAARAAACWQTAGDRAIRRGANREAIALLLKGLRALMAVPESTERDRSELALQLALAEALIADRGWTAAETQPCWARARALCERSGETAALFPILYGQFSTSLSRGQPDMHDLAQQALRLTQGSSDAGLSAVAHAMAGMSHFARGKFSVARVELGIALSLSSRASDTNTFLAADHNLAIASLWLAMALRQLGHAVEAAAHAAAGLAAARRLGNPHTLAHALALYCRYLSIVGDIPALHRAAEDLARLAAQHRFPFYAAAADIYLGWVLAERDIRRGLRMMREGTAAFVALGAIALQPWFLGRMAMLGAAIGEVREGLSLLDEALEQIDRSGQRWCHAELQRFKAELQAGGTGQRFPTPVFRPEDRAGSDPFA